ncbi:aminoglycoside phosphotransferase family protein [Actinoplanes regularis]|uniref:aminoglycoside phosphotransferase family protein n=1 Tax=Actinoplanes regularis TaxID=52697 RepID=UPI00249FBB33|nr:aminoglycoside phosphotransferase family protein [Actinoplanes regularis]GLW35241.1 aminoglycoside phosphotransferase [Actinoplanes regularis]
MTQTSDVLLTACRALDINPAGAELIRAGENTLFRLPGGIVARVTRADQIQTARKETRVSRWLQERGIPVVEILPDLAQPIEVGNRAVTFWRELPPHQEGSIQQVADILRQIHTLQPPPDLQLPPLAPFVRLEQRIAEATVLDDADRKWLLRHLAELQQRYANLPAGLPAAAVHGDAWGGNIVDTSDGPVVLDLERFAYGPPEWDLTSIAVDHVTFATMSATEWTAFCQQYGHDVTEWPGYPVLRDARELRKVTFAAQMANQFPWLKNQALYRLACIKGEKGARPWRWSPIP